MADLRMKGEPAPYYIEYEIDDNDPLFLVIVGETVDMFKAPEGFEEIERRRYDDTEFVFLRPKGVQSRLKGVQRHRRSPKIAPRLRLPIAAAWIPPCCCIWLVSMRARMSFRFTHFTFTMA